MISTVRGGSLALVTTARREDVVRYFEQLRDWASIDGVRLYIMMEEKDFTEGLEYVDSNNGICLISYQYEVGQGVAAKTRSRAPLLEQVIKTGTEVCASGSAWGFFNADIEAPKDRETLQRIDYAVAKAVMKGITTGFHRTDRDLSEESLYRDGFDLFVFGPKIKDMRQSDSVAMRIGQLGWDYAVPMYCERQEFSIDASCRLVHSVHSTGSTACWEEAIDQIMVIAEGSATRSRSISYYCVYILSRLGRGLSRILPRLKGGLRAFTTRVSYYGYIRPEIRSEWK